MVDWETAGRVVVDAVTIFYRPWGVFVRVAAAGLASLTGPGLVRPGHGGHPKVFACLHWVSRLS
jgi:hypothetical protein